MKKLLSIGLLSLCLTGCVPEDKKAEVVVPNYPDLIKLTVFVNDGDYYGMQSKNKSGEVEYYVGQIHFVRKVFKNSVVELPQDTK